MLLGYVNIIYALANLFSCEHSQLTKALVINIPTYIFIKTLDQRQEVLEICYVIEIYNSRFYLFG